MSFSSGTQRFKRQAAETDNVISGVNSTQFKHTKQSVFYKPEKTGRPLWMIELGKQCPSSADYEVQSQFGSTAKLLRTRTKSFKNCHDALNPMSKLEVQVIRFKKNKNKMPQEGIASYNISYRQTRREQTAHLFKKTKKDFLWNEQVQRASEIAPPALYNPNHHLVETQRFTMQSFGRSGRQPIASLKMTPGPGEHLAINYGLKNLSMNYMLQEGNKVETVQQTLFQENCLDQPVKKVRPQTVKVTAQHRRPMVTGKSLVLTMSETKLCPSIVASSRYKNYNQIKPSMNSLADNDFQEDLAQDIPQSEEPVKDYPWRHSREQTIDSYKGLRRKEQQHHARTSKPFRKGSHQKFI